VLHFIHRAVAFGWRVFSRRLGRLWLDLHGAEIGAGLVLYGLPIVEIKNGAHIKIGCRAVLCSLSRYTALGVSRPVIIRAMTANSVIVIGDDVGMSGTTICASEKISIGNECLFGADVMVCDTDFHPIEPIGRRYSSEGVRSAPVHIGSNVFLGARSVVLKGVSIGDNSVIGAGSMVVSNIPSNVIAAGNPCRVVRSLAKHETRSRNLEAFTGDATVRFAEAGASDK
jgi:acetyltransferase-like isoleucine patch superfamily enzyme